ncbi:glutamate-pyruvate transaminase/Glutamate-alanine transaminase [Trichosporon asahii var. asahii CBS 8904]|uniref:Glutamate pyruvate transaminase n=1 Tax=Trichosporon asahii var. asahii (strain CBS 8904) TaxID=1220162 RepID=K1VHP2_TRIAC|nr:glutamate-pyruvate transaminase/Glutamate-alanine transaminase [Trichosporon asahii var. asahii CBS 8904]
MFSAMRSRHASLLSLSRSALKTTTPALHANRISIRMTHKKALTLESINPAVLDVQYAVRGELALKADKYMHQLEDGDKSLPFDKVVTANIGNPQQKGLNQRPITYWRQVISLLENPMLMEEHLDVIKTIYPADVIRRAQSLHKEIGSVGAYTHSKGVLQIRQRVAKFIEKRDGYPSDPEMIFLTAGASAGVSQILGLALKPGDGAMIPIPQYPLYTATLSYIHGKPIPYYLNEDAEWSTNTAALREGVAKAKQDGTPIKALVVINPGNPTGACLTREAMEDVVRLCYEESILLLADEVYQRNIFNNDTKPFISFKEVVKSMDKDIADSVELVSFHSISKGVSGECGRRGGYFELCNIEPDVVDQIYKMASVTLCPPVTGQVGVDLLVNPPVEGDESYEQWKEETSLTHENLASRSKYMQERFSQLPNMSCQPADGAMYLFPRIDIPEKAIKEAEKRGKAPDVMYTLDLLDATGICAVAGSGFGQEPGTFHMRVTALCPGVEEYVDKIEKFHKDWIRKYE